MASVAGAVAGDFGHVSGFGQFTPHGGVSGARFSASGLTQGGGQLARLAGRLADADLLVDLGHGIGSAHWWRGAATLGVLAAAALSLGLHLPVIDGPVPAQPGKAALAELAPDAISPLSAGATTGFQAAPTPMVKRLAEPPERPRIELRTVAGAGGLEAALRRAGVGGADLDRVASAIAGMASMRGGIPGSDVRLVLGRRESKAMPRPLELLGFRAAFDKKVEVTRKTDGGLNARVIPIKIDDTPIRIRGAVGASLERSARAAGVPAAVVAEFLRQIGTEIDVKRQMKANQQFDMVIAHRRAETGEREFGRLLFAGLTGGRNPVGMMRWGNEFYSADGEGMRRGGPGTPVAGARMSSGFGMRFHPVLQYARLHKGVDFAAAPGTPILASSAGSVVMAGWGGGYGNVVVLDHGNGLRTRYAHMRKFVVQSGAKVRQGQKIGEVGTTGLSTGPHLHYEVWKNGAAVNPRDAKFHTRTQLDRGEMSRFKAQLAQYKGLPTS